MSLENLDQVLDALAGKKYLIATASKNSSLAISERIISSVNNAQDFINLCYRMMIQEQYKDIDRGEGHHMANLLYTLEIFRKLAMKLKYHLLDNSSKVTDIKIQDAEIGEIDQDNDIMLNINLENFVKTWKQKGIEYLIYVEQDDHTSIFLDNEKDTPVLAFAFFAWGCNRFSIPALRLLSEFEKHAKSRCFKALRISSKVKFKKTDELPPIANRLILYETPAEGCLDFNHTVLTAIRDQFISKYMLDHFAYKFRFADFYANTGSSSLTLATLNDNPADCTYFVPHILFDAEMSIISPAINIEQILAKVTIFYQSERTKALFKDCFANRKELLSYLANNKIPELKFKSEHEIDSDEVVELLEEASQFASLNNKAPVVFSWFWHSEDFFNFNLATKAMEIPLGTKNAENFQKFQLIQNAVLLLESVLRLSLIYPEDKDKLGNIIDLYKAYKELMLRSKDD